MPREEIILINLETGETLKVWADELCDPFEQFTNGKSGFVIANNLEVEEWVFALQKALNQRNH